MESIFEIYIFFSNEAAKERAINGTDFKASQKVYPGYNYHPNSRFNFMVPLRDILGKQEVDDVIQWDFPYEISGVCHLQTADCRLQTNPESQLLVIVI